MNNQHHACVLEANCYLCTFIVYFKLHLNTSFLIDPVLLLHTKIYKSPLSHLHLPVLLCRGNGKTMTHDKQWKQQILSLVNPKEFSGIT